MLKAPFVEIVEEQAADPPRLVAVRQEKVLVAPLLEFGVESLAIGIARSFGRPMPMHGILLKTVIRRQIEPTAKPPHRLLPFFLCREEPHIQVRGRRIGVVRMRNRRDAHRLKTPPRQLGAARRSGSAATHCPAHAKNSPQPARSPTPPTRACGHLLLLAAPSYLRGKCPRPLLPRPRKSHPVTRANTL